MGGTYTQQGDYSCWIFNYHPKKSVPLTYGASAGCAIYGNIVPFSIPT